MVREFPDVEAFVKDMQARFNEQCPRFLRRKADRLDGDGKPSSYKFFEQVYPLIANEVIERLSDAQLRSIFPGVFTGEGEIIKRYPSRRLALLDAFADQLLAGVVLLAPQTIEKQADRSAAEDKYVKSLEKLSVTLSAFVQRSECRQWHSNDNPRNAAHPTRDFPVVSLDHWGGKHQRRIRMQMRTLIETLSDEIKVCKAYRSRTRGTAGKQKQWLQARGAGLLSRLFDRFIDTPELKFQKYKINALHEDGFIFRGGARPKSLESYIEKRDYTPKAHRKRLDDEIGSYSLIANAAAILRHASRHETSFSFREIQHRIADFSSFAAKDTFDEPFF